MCLLENRATWTFRTFLSSRNTMPACHFRYLQPLSFVYCFVFCGPTGWTVSEMVQGLSYFPSVSCGFPGNGSIVLAPPHTTHARRRRLGFQLNPGVFLFLSWFSFTCSGCDLRFLSVSQAQYVCYSSWQDFYLLVYTTVNSMLSDTIESCSLGNGSFLLEQ